jgi:putative transposase
MLLKIVYLLARRVLGLAVLVSRGDRAKDAELLVLRHENAVLRRHAGWVRYGPAGRVWFAALARLIPRRRWTAVFPVTPATLLVWHRKLVGNKYDTSKRRKPGPRRRSGASPALSFAWRRRIRYGDTGASTANWPSSA